MKNTQENNETAVAGQNCEKWETAPAPYYNHKKCVECGTLVHKSNLQKHDCLDLARANVFNVAEHAHLLDQYISAEISADDLYDRMRLQGFTECETTKMINLRRTKLLEFGAYRKERIYEASAPETRTLLRIDKNSNFKHLGGGAYCEQCGCQITIGRCQHGISAPKDNRPDYKAHADKLAAALRGVLRAANIMEARRYANAALATWKGAQANE